MNAALTMEVVNTPVPTLLETLAAPAILAICWREIHTIAQVCV